MTNSNASQAQKNILEENILCTYSQPDASSEFNYFWRIYPRPSVTLSQRKRYPQSQRFWHTQNWMYSEPQWWKNKQDRNELRRKTDESRNLFAKMSNQIGAAIGNIELDSQIVDYRQARESWLGHRIGYQGWVYAGWNNSRSARRCLRSCPMRRWSDWSGDWSKGRLPNRVHTQYKKTGTQE